LIINYAHFAVNRDIQLPKIILSMLHIVILLNHNLWKKI